MFGAGGVGMEGSTLLAAAGGNRNDPQEERHGDLEERREVAIKFPLLPLLFKKGFLSNTTQAAPQQPPLVQRSSL